MTKILLVEDDKSLREIYGVRLLAEGYDIVSAGDGEEALAMAIKERPNLIVSDVMMPKISGFDMLDILRSTTETRGIKVIMMTALSSEDQRRRGEALGADRYLVKSQVGIEDVVRTVHDVLEDGDMTVEQRTAQKQAPSPAPVAENSPITQPTQIQQQTFGNTPTTNPVQNFERTAPTTTTPTRQAFSSAPARAVTPSLAQFERERPAPSFANQPAQPVSQQTQTAPVQQTSFTQQVTPPTQNNIPISTNQNFEAQKARTIEAPAHPISDFVNQPQQNIAQQQQHTYQENIPQNQVPTGGERIVQPVNNTNRSDEEMLAFQIDDILKGGSGDNPLNNSQPPFGAQ